MASRNKVTVLRDAQLDEEVFRRVFPSGLTAYVVRKPDFTRSYATIATRYGSIDTALRANGRPVGRGSHSRSVHQPPPSQRAGTQGCGHEGAKHARMTRPADEVDFKVTRPARCTPATVP